MATTNDNKEVKDCSKNIIDHPNKRLYPFNEQRLKIALMNKTKCRGSPLSNMKSKDVYAWLEYNYRGCTYNTFSRFTNTDSNIHKLVKLKYFYI